MIAASTQQVAQASSAAAGTARRITGQTVVVAGGSRGVGLGLVQRFLERDNKVIATARQIENATHLQSLSQTYKDKLQLTQLDVTDINSISNWAAELKNNGVQHVDVLVNNAGINSKPGLELQDFTPDEFIRLFQTNTMGPFFVIQQLHKQGLLGGEQPTLVVNMSSAMGSMGDPLIGNKLPGRYAYRSSKAALNAINKGLVLDIGQQNIEFVLMHPGYVKTDMTGGLGDVTVDDSTTGILAVLESDKPLHDHFYAFNGNELPW